MKPAPAFEVFDGNDPENDFRLAMIAGAVSIGEVAEWYDTSRSHAARLLAHCKAARNV